MSNETGRLYLEDLRVGQRFTSETYAMEGIRGAKRFHLGERDEHGYAMI